MSKTVHFGTHRQQRKVSGSRHCPAVGDAAVKKLLLDWRQAAFYSSGFDAEGEIH